MTGTEVVAVKDYAVMQESTKALLDEMAKNFGSGGASTSDLNVVKVPAGDNSAWEVPDLSDTGSSPQKVLTGVVLHYSDFRVYYATSLDEEGASGGDRPDCTSENCETGVGAPGGDCASCPFDEWGSEPKNGRGKACQEKRTLFLVQPTELLPMAITLPPTSANICKKAFSRILSGGTLIHGTSLNFGLKKTVNKGGTPYSEMTITVGEKLDAETLDEIVKLQKRMMPMLQAFNATTPDAPIDAECEVDAEEE